MNTWSSGRHSSTRSSVAGWGDKVIIESVENVESATQVENI